MMHETAKVNLSGVVSHADSAQAEAQGSGSNCAGMRQTSKTVLREMANDMRRRADRMDLLADQLPEKLMPSADAALWDILMLARSRG